METRHISDGVQGLQVGPSGRCRVPRTPHCGDARNHFGSETGACRNVGHARGVDVQAADQGFVSSLRAILDSKVGCLPKAVIRDEVRIGDIVSSGKLSGHEADGSSEKFHFC